VRPDLDCWLTEHGFDRADLEELLHLMKAAKDAPIVLRDPKRSSLIMATDNCRPLDTFAAARAAWNDLKTAFASRKGAKQ
jgi:hypothetical protein